MSPSYRPACILFALFAACTSTPISTMPRKAGAAQTDPNQVNPAWLELLLTDLADTEPVVASIDLAGAAESEQFSGNIDRVGHGVRYRHESDGGYIYAEYLGRTTDHLHVYKVARNYGGTGVFMDLLFVRFSRSWVLADGVRQERKLLRAVGQHTLGDRFTGAIRLIGDTLAIERPAGIREIVELNDLP